jgi:hypothetical protein
MKAKDLQEFGIEYDYFGLSSSAEVEKRKWRSEFFYRCFLHSSLGEVDIKQVKAGNEIYWIDMSDGTPTLLAQLLG